MAKKKLARRAPTPSERVLEKLMTQSLKKQWKKVPGLKDYVLALEVDGPAIVVLEADGVYDVFWEAPKSYAAIARNLKSVAAAKRAGEEWVLQKLHEFVPILKVVLEAKLKV